MSERLDGRGRPEKERNRDLAVAVRVRVPSGAVRGKRRAGHLAGERQVKVQRRTKEQEALKPAITRIAAPVTRIGPGAAGRAVVGPC